MVSLVLPLPSLSSPVVLFPAPASPAWKSIPTAREVPDTGTRASDLSLGSRGMPRIPSWTEYRRKEPTPATQTQGQSDTFHKRHAVLSTDSHNSGKTATAAPWRSASLAGLVGGFDPAMTAAPRVPSLGRWPRTKGTGRAGLNCAGWTCWQTVRLPEASLHRQPLRPPLV